jgi:NOL1/NOP2/fmu family ribosome biogenesis protein
MKKVLVLSIAVVLILFMGSSLASPRASKTIELTINSTQALVNGEKITLDQAPIILNQRTLVPLRFIGE